jgi:hypothetical protein
LLGLCGANMKTPAEKRPCNPPASVTILRNRSPDPSFQEDGWTATRHPRAGERGTYTLHCLLVKGAA